MVDVQELVVRATPQGVSDVKDQMGDMSEGVEQSGEQMEETAGKFGDLRKQFAGATGAIAAAFAVVSGTLLSRVPVLGETASAFGSVLDAVGLKIDSVLRPALSRLNNLIFDLSGFISNAEGPLGTFIGILGTLIAVGLAVGSVVLSVVTGFLALGGSLGTVISVAGTVVSAIGAVAGAIVSLPGLIAVGIAVLVAFIAAYLTNWNGARDKTDAIIGEIVDFVVDGFNSLVAKGGKLLGKFVDKVTEFGSNVMSALVDKLGDIGSIAFSLGKKFVLALLSGVESVAQLIVDALTNILNANISAINTIIDTLPDEVASRLSIDTVGKIEAPSVSGTVNTAVDEGQDFIGSVGGGRGTINLDGRDVENSQGRYRADNLHRRGG